MDTSQTKAERRRQWDARPEVQAARAQGECGARTKRDTPCSRPGKGAGGRCPAHGGKSTGQREWAAGGRFSRSRAMREFRERIAGRAREADLLDVSGQVAVLDEVEEALLERALNQGDTPDLRLEGLRLVEQVLRLLTGGDEEAAQELVQTTTQLHELLKRGVAYDRALLEVSRITERRARLALDTRSTLVREANVVTVQQLEMIYMRMMGEAVAIFGPEKAAELERRVRRALGAEAALLEARAGEDG